LNRYTDNKVFVALSHGELCVFRRDMSKIYILFYLIRNFCFFCFIILAGRWDLDSPILRTLEEVSARQGTGNGEIDDGNSIDPISVMALAAGKLWCAIRDKIFVVCPNSLNIEVKFSLIFLFFTNKQKKNFFLAFICC